MDLRGTSASTTNVCLVIVPWRKKRVIRRINTKPTIHTHTPYLSTIVLCTPLNNSRQSMDYNWCCCGSFTGNPIIFPRIRCGFLIDWISSPADRYLFWRRFVFLNTGIFACSYTHPVDLYNCEQNFARTTGEICKKKTFFWASLVSVVETTR